jgi:hypothetical protein
MALFFQVYSSVSRADKNASGPLGSACLGFMIEIMVTKSVDLHALDD